MARLNKPTKPTGLKPRKPRGKKPAGYGLPKPGKLKPRSKKPPIQTRPSRPPQLSKP